MRSLINRWTNRCDGFRRKQQGAGARVVGVLLVFTMLLLSACTAGENHSGKSDVKPITESPRPAVIAAETGRRPWLFERRDGLLITTGHYRLRTTEDNPYILDRLPGFLEASLDRYASQFTKLPLPSRPMDVYLFENRGQWKRFTARFLGPQADLYLQIPRGGYSINGTAVLWQIGPRDTFSIAAHEGWHQYTQTMFRGRLPVWLEEGVATYMEGYKFRGKTPVFYPWANSERFDQLRDAEGAGTLLPLRQLLTSSPQQELQATDRRELNYYAQVWALTHFLAEAEGGKYRPGLNQLLKDAAAGTIGERLLDIYSPREAVAVVHNDRGLAVFRAYFGLDLKQVENEYFRFIRQIISPGSKNRIVAGESPVNHD